MPDFTDKIVLVTGATGNLGSAVAEAFAASGAHLVLPDRSTQPEERLSAWAHSDRHLLAGNTNLTDAASVQAMVDQAMARFGRIDVLAHTVGGYRAGSPPHETTLETWDMMMNLNARSTLIVNQAVVTVMLKQGAGKIINTAARSALHSGANEVAYSASKSAVARITESMAAAYRAKGINVNAILPGTIDTPENRAAMPKADFNRWVKPEELARVILFLASDDAEPINGALIPAYGLS